jgi:hypothetical protein
MAVAAFREVGSVAAARRPILPADTSKIGRREIKYLLFLRLKSAIIITILLLFYRFSFVDNSKITIFALLN